MSPYRLITIDATGTIFRFKEPPNVTYARFAQRNHIKCNELAIKDQFKQAYKHVEQSHPNFGSTSGISSQDWWKKVVHRTFEGTTAADNVKPFQLSMVSHELYEYYKSAEAYHIFDDFLDFVKAAEPKKQQGIMQLAVISNFDIRLHTILQRLNIAHHFDLIMTSEEAKSSKPSKDIFVKTIKELGLESLSPNEILHIGDDKTKDCPPTGWHRVLIQRENNQQSNSILAKNGGICASFDDLSKLVY